LHLQNRTEHFDMIIVPVKDGEPIEKTLKKFKKKVEKTGLIRELRDRQKFTKPSVRKRESRIRAIYRQQLINQLD
jgi:small subunit ribosomal protein S21